jgi:NAD-dependent dihydropyrimidine dehydrogenase PreA subunit
VTGTGTLIDAIAAGKRAAVSIDKRLAGKNASLDYEPEPVAVKEEIVLGRAGNLPRQRRIPLAIAPPSRRRRDFNITTSTQTREEAMAEAARCLNCGCGVACGLCYRVCMALAVKEQNGRYEIDREKCHACGMCFQRCPNLNIEMVRTAPRKTGK